MPVRAILLHCKCHWPTTLLVLLSLPSLAGLGVWQLLRAQEKQALLLSYQQLQAKPKVNLRYLTAPQRVDYLPVYLQGHFDRKHYWLLDNRSRNSRAGYEVVVPLIADQLVILVNIGWVHAALERSRLPIIDLPAGPMTVAGHLYTPQKNPFISTGESDLAIPWPKRVLQIDWEIVTRDLGLAGNGATLVEKILRVDADDPVALEANWMLVNVDPSKHQAYAFQWFALLTALLILYGWHLKSAVDLSKIRPSPASKKINADDN